MPRSAAVLGGGKLELDPVAFEAPFNMALVHETVRAEQNARRRGTASTRTRGEVSGGGAKPWRQKGTGRARAGSSRSPLWTGGAVVFGPSPRSYTVKVNRKARRGALRGALSVHAERGSIAVFDAGFEEPSTKRAAELLADWGAREPTLVLLGAEEAAAGKSFRNLTRVEAMPVADAGVAELLWAASLLVSEAAMPELVRRASARERDARAGSAAASGPEGGAAGAAAASGPEGGAAASGPEGGAADAPDAAAAGEEA